MPKQFTLTAVNISFIKKTYLGTSVNKLFNLNWNLGTTIAMLLLGCLLTTDSFAKGLYKSVNANGKITYSNHPPSDSKTAQNISSLKGSPKFSAVDKQFSRAPRKS